MKWRVRRVAPSAIEFDPPCGCSCNEPHTVWEGDDPAEYRGGIGAFDEGCHHPVRWWEQKIGDTWVACSPPKGDEK